MDFENCTEEVQQLIENTFDIVCRCKSRYIMPEDMLYAMTFNRNFIECFEKNGGSTDELRMELMEFIRDNGECAKTDDDIRVTEDFGEMFARAEVETQIGGREKIDLAHIFSAMMSLEESHAVYFLLKQNVDLLKVMGELSRLSLAEERSVDGEEAEYEYSDEDGWYVPGESSPKSDKWKQYVECISDHCKEKNPLIGREKELDRTIQILCRMDKNNVLHVGEAGVGKTALVYGLTRRIEEGNIPEQLKKAKVYAMDMGTMVAGTQYRGEFEQRFKMVMKGLESLEKPILYLDEIHNIVGAGATGEGSLDLSNMLKPYLSEGKIRFIGATTYEEYRRYIGKSRSLMRRFGKVDIPEPSREEAVEILKGLKRRYEKFHGVKYAAGVMKYAVDMSSKYINERFLPDKAIDLIDEAGAYRNLHPLEQKTQTVAKGLIDDMISLTCNVPKQRIEQDDIEKLARLENDLKKQVFGQDEAIGQVSNAIKFSRAGLNEENKPVASFLFVGPTGVGKTETAKALAGELGIAFLRFDMSEYAEKHTVAKLIGSPAGYVGYEDGGLLTEEVRKHPYAVLLLDEMEKAHPDIYNILLQVMDYATLTDNQGRKADFRNIIIIMTSNAGASKIGKKAIGFGSGKMDESAVSEAVKRTFQPEFRNRLSRIVIFHGMDEAMAGQITGKKLMKLQELLAAKKIEMHFTKEAEELIRRKGITDEYGARQIERVIDGEIKPLLVEQMLFGRLKKGGKVVIDAEDQTFKLK